MSDRDRFFEGLRRALGRTPEAKPPAVPPAGSRHEEVKADAEARAGELLAELEVSAAQAGWQVHRAASTVEASEYVATLAAGLEARSVVCTTHSVLDRLGLAALLAESGRELHTIAMNGTGAEPPDAQRAEHRERAIAADMGVTGVDYAIAETGSCAIVARKGVSRLASLLPPVHVAVVERGQVLPSLDELFALRRHSHAQGDAGSYMNIISGPSRSGDIEQTLVTGVHGPREVHMVLLG